MVGREASRPGRLGPGIFVGVMGPSGAGKDTLINLAQVALAGRTGVVFVRRVVTRPSDGSEDHSSMTPEAFVRAAALGAFALSWHAHGHDYGLPAEIDGDIRAGRVVVANISRDVTMLARARYENARLVHVTAPPEVLAARRAARHRASEAMEEGASRTERVAVQVGLGPQDIEIVNGGLREAAAEQLVAFLTALLDGREADRDCDGVADRA
ncbi:phosphonate metabolism protein/1,5-bisphosphokinase (PRPP-forming) PhnN [Blastochloris sulfoviridis]|uniref:ribose 1,5-bisphosphate phosphokinase n=1 Tax=Blastochloris sulfoviridis TaxID=50712 RepID=A0A5M6I5T1_9HYPH|nr:phosphonate metabolism protein/1,5-bisphosphokinase (PRPP-forming) PhnN [Blastochloris sulfoviridis]KAA5603584.1 phosphonate metabolism protein/1,5-bisphosphokinase (PRPP-forming) PhnN [Blastochloris sulfoviridis]